MTIFIEDIVKKYKKISNYINLQNIASVVAIGASLYYLFELIYNTFYRLNCENFYGIPDKYFSSDILTKIIASIIISIIYFLPLIYCYNKRLYLIKDLITIFILFLCLDLSSYIINLCYFAEMITLYNWEFLAYLSDKSYFYGIFLILNSIPYILMFFHLKSKRNNIIYYKIKNDKSIKFFKNYNVLYVIAIVLYLIIFIIEISFPFLNTIENKRKYEFVSIKGNEYVVLSHVDDKVLICDFDEYDDTCVFYTSNYRLKNESDNMTYSYRYIADEPIINTEKAKADIVESSIKSAIDR